MDKKLSKLSKLSNAADELSGVTYMLMDKYSYALESGAEDIDSIYTDGMKAIIKKVKRIYNSLLK